MSNEPCLSAISLGKDAPRKLVRARISAKKYVENVPYDSQKLSHLRDYITRLFVESFAFFATIVI